MNDSILMSSNPLVKHLQKQPADFTKADLIKFIEDNKIKMVNFRYTGGDGRLKTLNFIINNKQYLDSILSAGERVDGSSLFSHIEAGASDLYVIPRYRTAFVNPFSEIPSLDILCSFYNKDGEPLAIAPDYILRKASKCLTEQTGYNLEAMGELEFYVIGESDNLFKATDQKGYHESDPFSKFAEFRNEAIEIIAACGGSVKYAHSEVGNFSENNLIYEQNEIEFLPTDICDAADQLVIAKWILRNLAYQYNLTVTFAPKITFGKAGSGLHVHMRLMKDHKNAMIENGKINDTAKKIISGLLQLAPSLTAFGNINPTSYFRLVPNQEAPTYICWGDRNRSVLVRVPLGWSNKNDMLKDANPLEVDTKCDYSDKQTVEYRCSDGTANVYLLLAGIAVAVRYGLQNDKALEIAANTYADTNIFSDCFKQKLASLKQLPPSCWDSAECLLKQADIYKQYNIFTEAFINGVIEDLKKFNDKNLRKEINGDKDKILELVNNYFHCG
ncbi:MAG: glutamine synthetase [Bacteroidales bacterium]|nr:glutamine synthetase [Bacteroidales bacterium]